MIDLEKVKDFKVLFVGDAIRDEYHYVRPVGKAVKESAISVMFEEEKVFYGGVWAASNHLKSFCAHVQHMSGPNTMVNTRLVENIYLRKLFVIHKMEQTTERIDPVEFGWYDLVVITDFGHGTMTKELIERVTRRAKFLCVNTQTNSTNYGFNLITKYPLADLVVLDELEARLAVHDKDSAIEDVILKLARMAYKRIIVTLGVNGAIGFDGAFERLPAVADKVVDTMGAGDAFLALASPFAAAGFSMRDLLRIGNAAGAIKVGIVGHSASVDKETLRKYLNG